MWSTYFHYSERTSKDVTKNAAYGKTFIKMYKHDPNSVPKMSFTFKEYGKYIAIDNRNGECLKKEFYDPIKALKSVGLTEQDLK